MVISQLPAKVPEVPHAALYLRRTRLTVTQILDHGAVWTIGDDFNNWLVVNDG